MTESVSEALNEAIVSDDSVITVESQTSFMKILRVKPEGNGDLFSAISRHGSWHVRKVIQYSDPDTDALMVVIEK